MKHVVVPNSAVTSGALRLTLRRIPELGGHIVLKRVGGSLAGSPGDVVAETWLYGRGVGSAAQEQAVLRFLLQKTEGVASVVAGETLVLIGEESDEPLELDIINVK